METKKIRPVKAYVETADWLAKYAKEEGQTIASVLKYIVDNFKKEADEEAAEFARIEAEWDKPIITPEGLEEQLIPYIEVWRSKYFVEPHSSEWRGTGAQLMYEFSQNIPQWKVAGDHLRTLTHFKECLNRLVLTGRRGVFYSDLQSGFKIKKEYFKD